jgi:peptidoglycan hydrolase CwlO-like protein
VSQSQIDALNEQKQALAAKKQAASAQIATLKSQQAGYLEQKQALDDKCEIMRQDIDLLEKQINLYDDMIAQEGEKLETAEQQRDEQLVRYRTRVRAMEENGKYNYFAVLFSATSLGDLLSKMDDIGEIMQSDKDLEDSYKASVAECKELKAQYEDTQSQMQENQTELKSEKADLETQIAQASDMIASLQGNIDEYTAAYKENESAENQVIYPDEQALRPAGCRGCRRQEGPADFNQQEAQHKHGQQLLRHGLRLLQVAGSVLHLHNQQIRLPHPPDIPDQEVPFRS